MGNDKKAPSTRNERVNLLKGKNRFFNRKWLLLVSVTSLLLIIAGCFAIILSAKTYSLDEIDKVDISTVIYARDNKTVVGKIGSQNREYLTYDQIERLNPDLPKAFVKVEDERFYEHHGIDYYSLGRAFLRNLKSLKSVEGASTITMQVVSNVVLKDRRKTYTRKLKEAVASLNLEREASKKKILEAYMNYISFGNNVYGVQLASKIYFGKDLTKDKLDYHEIALLAGLPKAPTGYNPYGNARQQKKALERRNVALMLMSKDTGSIPAIITKEQKQIYQKKPLGVNIKFKQMYLKQHYFDSFRDYVQREARDRYGLTYSDLNNGGYKIYTTMDKQAQLAVENAMRNDSFFEHDKKVNIGVTLLNPSNGQLVALGGGRNFSPGSYNWALQKKPPGSSIKPLTVFGPIVEFKNYNEYTMVLDKRFYYKGWSPNNYVKGMFYGNVPLKEVVYRSLNAATARMLIYDLGVAKSYAFATKSLELPLSPKDEVPAALALGGLTEGLNTLNMARAYSSFANEGMMPNPYAILKIVDQNGQVINPLSGKELSKMETLKRVFSKRTSFYMTRMLQEVITNPNGTGHKAKLYDSRPVAGKTGTNQKANSGWFVGFTPDLVGAVLVFNEPGGKLQITGGNYPAKIFSYIMSLALKGKPISYFRVPEGVREPVKPLDLKAPLVTAFFDIRTNSIHLKWQKQDIDDITYEIYRSSDGNDFKLLDKVAGDISGYTDTNIKLPNVIDPTTTLNEVYYYKVVAIRRQDGKSVSSNIVKVVVNLKPKNAPPRGEQDESNSDSNQEAEEGFLEDLE